MKVPEPRQMTSGKWFIQLRLNGVSTTITEDTRKACIRKAELIKAEHRAGNKVIKRREDTLGSLIDKYIAKYESVLSVSTVRGYSSVRRNRFQSVMDKPIKEINDWQKIINDELKIKSEHTVKNGWGIVSSALKDAGYPVPHVKLAPVPDADLPFLQPEEIKPFLEAIQGDTAEIYALLELHSLRQSEALAVVRNKNWDIKNGTITVSGAIVPNKENKYVEKTTNKTKKSSRVIPIMIPRLKELIEEHEEEGFAELTPLTILKHVHAACKRAGVTDVTNHDLRRTFASLGFFLRVPERIIVDMGGWENPDTVHRIYIKLAATDKQQTASEFSAFYSLEEDIDKRATEDLKAFVDKYEGKTNKAFKKLFLEARKIIENAN